MGLLIRKEVPLRATIGVIISKVRTACAKDNTLFFFFFCRDVFWQSFNYANHRKEERERSRQTRWSLSLPSFLFHQRKEVAERRGNWAFHNPFLPQSSHVTLLMQISFALPRMLFSNAEHRNALLQNLQPLLEHSIQFWLPRCVVAVLKGHRRTEECAGKKGQL